MGFEPGWAVGFRSKKNKREIIFTFLTRVLEELQLPLSWGRRRVRLGSLPQYLAWLGFQIVSIFVAAQVGRRLEG